MSGLHYWIVNLGLGKRRPITETCIVCDGDGKGARLGDSVLPCGECDGRGWVFPEALIEKVGLAMIDPRNRVRNILTAVVSYIEGGE